MAIIARSYATPLPEYAIAAVRASGQWTARATHVVSRTSAIASAPDLDRATADAIAACQQLAEHASH